MRRAPAAPSACRSRPVERWARSRALKRHLEHEALLGAVVRSTSDAILTKTLDGTITSWNPAAERVYGYSAEEAVGANVGMLLPPERRDELADILRRVGTGEGIREHETRRVDKRGGLREIALTVSPIRDPAGEIVGASAIARDITERKRGEELLRLAVEASPEAMIMVDQDRRIVLANARAETLFGYLREDLVGQPVEMLVPERAAPAHPGLAAEYAAAPIARPMGAGRDLFARRKDGSEVPVEIGLNPISTSQGRFILAAIIDISERLANERRMLVLQAEAAHASRVNAAGQMAGALAHELSQPLTAVNNYIRAAQRMLAQKHPDVDATVLDFVGKASEQSQRAGGIIRRLRDFIGNRSTLVEPHDINRVVEEGVETALIGMPHPDLRVERRYAPDLPRVSIDRVQIQQVVVNLVRNAVEAMEVSSQRTLTVATGKSGDFLEISFADTGPGLSVQDYEHLFEPFTTTKKSGMGIGLTICNSIIEAHAGVLSASGKDGGGTVFRFTLPVTVGA